MGNTNNGVNCDATWSKVMTKKKVCMAAVLAILDVPNSEPIGGTLVCHHKAKRSVTKKKAADATKKKAVEKRKAGLELRKVANPIGAEFKKAASAMATLELRKVQWQTHWS